ncbi:protein translocase subunit SecF [Cryptosporangium aurantiacum]|uniref:Protein-export membrane protein SecF n=1 Tax=Cryptosporangium aurantiacum TaxID=134849 RepID=A0A1M7RFM5_9ACTN|nr:protein translocase subunit SecF [Cryptosporangium aurantiacum]SHN45054.1 protein translocase subunit secF [Cryptosporangium aurantiacum]
MGLAGRLYRGETNIDFIGSRKRWYIASAILILICIGAFVFRGFNWGIEFSGGTSFVFKQPSGVTAEQVTETIEATGVEVQTTQEAGRGADAKFVIKTATLTGPETTEVKQALAAKYELEANDITDNAVSSSWGGQVTDKALIALIVFLVLVAAYLAIRFETKMAIAALLALLHDLMLTAGAYSIIGFEVTPSTIVGLLTILGFSLYDTVVVFDKVSEDTRGIVGGSRIDYAEAANNAVNETLMRSINTSLISLLPVGGLLFVGAGLLGVGTLKDLALVLFVGLAAGAYSSLFLATPWLVDMKEREPRYKALKERVRAKRAAAARAAESAEAEAEVEETAEAEEPTDADEDAREPATAGAGSGTTRTTSSNRPSQQQRRRPSGNRPGRSGGNRKKR